jgi:hypothetical protein
MRRIVIGVLALVALAAPADAVARNFVPCGTTNGWELKFKPRTCVLKSGPYGYQQLKVRKIRWRSWGGATAYGRGTAVDNMRFRAPVRFKLHRLRLLRVPAARTYTRASGTTFSPYSGPIRWRNKKLLPST